MTLSYLFKCVKRGTPCRHSDLNFRHNAPPGTCHPARRKQRRIGRIFAIRHARIAHVFPGIVANLNPGTMKSNRTATASWLVAESNITRRNTKRFESVLESDMRQRDHDEARDWARGSLHSTEHLYLDTETNDRIGSRRRSGSNARYSNTRAGWANGTTFTATTNINAYRARPQRAWRRARRDLPDSSDGGIVKKFSKQRSVTIVFP